MRLIACATCLLAIPLLAAQAPSYVRDVRPILDSHCTSCHQPAEKQSELDLTTVRHVPGRWQTRSGVRGRFAG